MNSRKKNRIRQRSVVAMRRIGPFFSLAVLTLLLFLAVPAFSASAFFNEITDVPIVRDTATGAVSAEREPGADVTDSTGETGTLEASLYYIAADTSVSDAVIYLQQAEGHSWLFLPSSADTKAMVLRFAGEEAELAGNLGSMRITSGVPFDLSSVAIPDSAGKSALALSRGEESVTFYLMKSANVRTLFLTSADPEKGRSWIEADKSRKAKDGGAVLLRPDGSVVYDGLLKNIKTRGNSTWFYEKKPYQIKLAVKSDLLETGDPREKAGTWVLLANYIDDSLLRNQLTLDLAGAFGLAYSPHSAPVDLYFDGEYRGTYQLCEKTEIAPGRVDIRDLESEIEDANPDTEDLEELPKVIAEDSDGCRYQYIDGLAMPEDFSGGYLLELDYASRAQEEASWFSTENGTYVVCKSPEFLSAEGVEYISALYRHFENAVFHGGVDPDTGKDYTEFIDLDSLVRSYLILELSGDNDAFYSSTFFFKPEDSDKLYAGPVWDFDTAFGNSLTYQNTYIAAQSPIGKHLMQIPSFCSRAQELWDQELDSLLRNVILKGTPERQVGQLHPLSVYEAEISASRRMNSALWENRVKQETRIRTPDLRETLEERSAWLATVAPGWTRQEIQTELFADVLPGAWYYDAVHAAAERGLFSPDVNFRPEKKLTREMLATLLYRLDGAPEVNGSSGFSDAAVGAWYYNALVWAAETGVVQGYDDGRFGVGSAVTREELAAMLYRYAQARIGTVEIRADLSAFSDAASVSAYAVEPMQWAVGSGLLVGMDDSRLAPLSNTSRAQAATVMERFCGLLPQEDINGGIS